MRGEGKEEGRLGKMERGRRRRGEGRGIGKGWGSRREELG